MRRTLVALACALGALAATPALAPAAVQVGSSGWQWGNPLPQGNAIRALSSAGTQGYAGNDFGTLLHTTDAGAPWTGLPSGTFAGLTEVQAIDGDSVFAGGACVARRSDDGGRTFKRLAFTPVDSSCREGLAAGLVRERAHRLPGADRRHRAAHGQRRRHIRPAELAASRSPRAGRPHGPASTCDPRRRGTLHRRSRGRSSVG